MCNTLCSVQALTRTQIACLWCAHQQTTFKHGEGRGGRNDCVVLKVTTQLHSTAQTDKAHTLAACASNDELQFVSSCVCWVWSSHFVLSVTLHCLYSPIENLGKMPKFLHAGYLTTFIWCRVNRKHWCPCNQGCVWLPLFIACLNISNQTLRELTKR